MEKDSGSRRKSSRDKREKKIFGLFPAASKYQTVSEQDVKELVDETTELVTEEKRMINDILELGDMTAREIMSPRVDMIMASEDEKIIAALERMRGTGFSRLPVYREDIDDIVGIVNYKDLIGPLIDGKTEDPVSKYMYEPMFVPETKNALTLLSEMQEKHRQMAIVVDEYGGTDGLLTVEDIVEEIVGDIVDETDPDREILTFLGPDTWRVDGSLPVENALELGWIEDEGDDCETIAGWLMDQVEGVPATGNEFVIGDYSFLVEKMRRNRISSIKVSKVSKDEAKKREPEGD
ncbi:MAG: hemolysin family protein [Eggerthellaceae bacterium]|nr:hemolysin family protein [Eggerthellaceae bacterium]